MELTREILQEIEALEKTNYELLLQLAVIPAPSNHEEKRAAFCKEWLEKQGAKGVYIDEALNVIYPIGCTEKNPVTVYMAHSDVVFPDMEALPLRVEDGRIYCPGIGDDTASASALLTAAGYIAKKGWQTKDEGILLVINSGEEGLGNLKGVRKICEDYFGRIRELISFDSHSWHVVNRAVGSRRYKIEIDTEGGHSYGRFGNANAIAYLASLINALYTVKIPPKGKTTYNVGTINGGTSVNTIAQHAEMLYEFRSDEKESLDIMENHLQAALAFYRAKGVEVKATLVGDRPCSGNVDEEKQKALQERAEGALYRVYQQKALYGAGSTDCNMPLSLGIPSICMGCYVGDKGHTREEYVEIDSLLPGLKVVFDMILQHF